MNNTELSVPKGGFRTKEDNNANQLINFAYPL
jgi:hypothetical protein